MAVRPQPGDSECSRAFLNTAINHRCLCFGDIIATGGNGPHSGGGKEHGRANWIARGSAPTDALAGLTPVAPNGAGSLRTAPITASGTELRLRIATETNVATKSNAPKPNETAPREVLIKVYVEGLDGTDLLFGVAKPLVSAQPEATVGDGTQEVVVAWGGVDQAGSSTLSVVRGRTVVLRMELSGGATLFSYKFV